MSQQEAKNQLKETVKETTRNLRKTFSGDMSTHPQKNIHLGELLSQANNEQKELPSRGKNPTPVVHGDGASQNGQLQSNHVANTQVSWPNNLTPPINANMSANL